MCDRKLAKVSRLTIIINFHFNYHFFLREIHKSTVCVKPPYSHAFLDMTFCYYKPLNIKALLLLF